MDVNVCISTVSLANESIATARQVDRERLYVAGWPTWIRKLPVQLRSSVRHASPTMVGEGAHEASSKLRNFCTKECILSAEHWI